MEDFLKKRENDLRVIHLGGKDPGEVKPETESLLKSLQKVRVGALAKTGRRRWGQVEILFLLEAGNKHP